MLNRSAALFFSFASLHELLLPSSLESYLGIIGGGPHAQDRSSQGYYEHDYECFLAVLKKNGKKLDNRSGQTGAGRGGTGRVRGVASQASATAGEDQEDGRADRCNGVQAVRVDGRGDRDCGRE